MKIRQILAFDWVWASLVAIIIFLAGFSLDQQPSNNYYEVTVQNFQTNGSIFLSEYPSYFTELVPTNEGPVMVLPPFPLLPSYIGSIFSLGELEMTKLGVGISVALMYLILRQFKMRKLKARIGSLLYFVTTPMLFFFLERGYWLSAQTWGVVGAQLALLFLLKQRLGWAGIGTAIAILSRINLGFLTLIFFSIYILKTYKLKQLITYLVPALLGVAMLLMWNYYRFGSLLTFGYDLIPGILDESWYQSGIMHPSYIWNNFGDFVWQFSEDGMGIGIVWMQPYLLLLPWVINRQNWWLILLAIIQFVAVLAHGEKGGYQLDFRYLMDSLWILVPMMLLEKRVWLRLMIWTLFVVSAIMHLANI